MAVLQSRRAPRRPAAHIHSEVRSSDANFVPQVAHALHAIPLRTPYVHAPRSAHVFSDSSRTRTPRTPRHSDMRCISSWNCCITDYEHGLLIVHHTCISIAIHRRSLIAPSILVLCIVPKSLRVRLPNARHACHCAACLQCETFHTPSLRSAILLLTLPPPDDAGASYVMIRRDSVSRRMREGPRRSRRQATRVQSTARPCRSQKYVFEPRAACP